MSKVKKTNIFFMVIMILLSVQAFMPASVRIHLPIKPQYAVSVYEFVLLFIPSLIFVGAIRKEKLKKAFRLNFIPITDFLLVIALAFILYPVMAFLGAISQLFFHNYLNTALDIYKSIPLWKQVLIIAGTPAICEEAIMRGAILSGYEKVNIKKAALMNGLFFGLFHMNLQQFFYAFALGIFFAFLVYATDSIFASATCHFIVNGTSMVLSYAASKMPKTNTPKNYKLTSSMMIASYIFLFIVAAAMVVLAIYIIKFLNKRRLARITRINEQPAAYTGYSINAYNGGKMSDYINDGNVKEEKVFDWSIAVIFIIYIAFIIIYQILTNTSMFK